MLNSMCVPVVLTAMHMNTNIIFICHLPECEWLKAFQIIIIYFWFMFFTLTSDLKILIIFFKTSYLKKN